MTIETALTRRLALTYPIIQAPLAGGGDTPALVAAVSGAGALGFIGAAYLAPPRIIDASRAVRAQTDRPFGINLFAPQPAPQPPANIKLALDLVAPFFAELGLPPPVAPTATADSFDAQFAAVLDSGASIFSFTLGHVPAAAIDAARRKGMYVVGSATTVAEAVALEQQSVDAIVVQGAEAGGHRATFAGDFESAMIGSMALVPQVVDAVAVPVIASGGIMDGRGIVAALALGAAAVQMGTAFLTCDEAGIPEAYKAAIVAAHEQETRMTRAFSGRPARGIVNRFMTAVDGAGNAQAILPFPLQNALTRPLRRAAATQGKAGYLSLWAGQGSRLARRRPAADLVVQLGQEIGSIVDRLARARSS